MVTFFFLTKLAFRSAGSLLVKSMVCMVGTDIDQRLLHNPSSLIFLFNKGML